MTASVVISARDGATAARLDGTRVCFSPHQCFAFDGGADDVACLERLAQFLAKQSGLAMYAGGPLLRYLLQHAPGLESSILGVIPLDDAARADAEGLRLLDVTNLPKSVKSVFLCDTHAVARMSMRTRLGGRVKVIEPEVLAEIAADVLPARAWSPVERSIYPIDVPEIVLKPGQDLILMDCPARNLALMPNGLAYVNNALKKASVTFQVFDLDIVTYHRFHIRRLFDEGGRIVLPSGRVLPLDPWQAEHYDLWNLPEVIEYFMPIIEEAAAEVIAAKPKILGLSVQQCSEAYSRRLVNLVRAGHPDVIVVVGGFSCYNADIGLKAFPEADYMCIGESDLTVGPLMEALVRGERPRNVPGVCAHDDDPTKAFIPAPMPHNLSALESPKYEWFDLNIYRNFNGYQLVPIIASRGCRWSRCTFCAERFYWRIRDPKEFADEVEWLASQGCTLFMFNESDLNGQPEKVLEICEEIIRRNLNVKLTGQLRIHKKSDKHFFQTLRRAGFVALRFGVDAFSESTLRLQKKGYTTAMVSQNLKDCWEAGIFTEVNWVIGVPGETDADVEEGIQLILHNRDYIGRLANINPLILVNGGVYWLDPESHNIVFREDKDKIMAEYPKVIPSDLWYSTGPYIDAQVRKQWFDQIVIALHDNGFPVGAWAARVIEDVKYARDRNRAGGAKSSAGMESSPDVAPAEVADEAPVAQLEAPPEPAETVAPEPVVAETPAPEPEPAPEPAPAAASDPPKLSRKSDAPLVGAEIPRLVRELTTHNVIFYKGLFYALPKGLGALDVSKDNVSGLPGVIVDSDENAVLAEIEIVSQWADSRGHFDAQEKQRAEGSYMRAASAGLAPEAEIEAVRKPIVVLYEGQHFAVEAADMARAFPSGDLAHVEVLHVVSKDATPDMLRTIGRYNLVEYDGRFYGCPHGVPIDWQNLDPEAIPGMIVATTAKEATALIELEQGMTRTEGYGETVVEVRRGPAEQFNAQPQLLETIGDYNVVAYEGWVYGIPHSLGPIDLRETDVTELPGIVKDVARDVVVNELKYLAEQSCTIAAE